MNDLRIERALRGGPPFATSYRSQQLVLDRPVRSGGNVLRPVAALAVVAAILAAALTLMRFIPGPGLPARPATHEELNGPVQVTPYVVPDALLLAIDQECRRTLAIAEPAQLLLIDARGGGIAYTWFLLPNGDLTDCMVEQLDPVTIVPSSSVTGPHPLSITPGSMEWADHQFTHALGRLGEGIVSVRVGPVGGELVTASISGSWFAAYWDLPPNCDQGDEPQVCNEIHYRAEGLDADGVVVATLPFDFPARQP